MEAFNLGDHVQRTVNLNVRSTASTSGTLLTTESSGSKGTIASGTSQSANGFIEDLQYPRVIIDSQQAFHGLSKGAGIAPKSGCGIRSPLVDLADLVEAAGAVG